MEKLMQDNRFKCCEKCLHHETICAQCIADNEILYLQYDEVSEVTPEHIKALEGRVTKLNIIQTAPKK